MAKRKLSPEEKRALRLQELCGDQYDELSTDQCKEEIARLAKIQMDHVENKKAQVETYNELIKDTKDKIEFLVEKIDHLNHEAAVAAQLGN
jgi:hypothetical protein